MIVTTSILALPFVVLIWFVDSYVVMSSLRLVAGQSARARASTWFDALRTLVDPLPEYIGGRLGNRPTVRENTWIAWVIVMFAAIVTRSVLMGIVIGISNVARG